MSFACGITRQVCDDHRAPGGAHGDRYFILPRRRLYERCVRAERPRFGLLALPVHTNNFGVCVRTVRRSRGPCEVERVLPRAIAADCVHVYRDPGSRRVRLPPPPPLARAAPAAAARNVRCGCWRQVCVLGLRHCALGEGRQWGGPAVQDRGAGREHEPCPRHHVRRKAARPRKWRPSRVP